MAYLDPASNPGSKPERFGVKNCKSFTSDKLQRLETIFGIFCKRLIKNSIYFLFCFHGEKMCCMVLFTLIISLVPYPDGTLSWATETNAYKKRDLLGNTLKENAPTKPLKANILFHSHVWISSELQSKKSGENRKLIFTVFSGYQHGVRKKLFS